MAVMSNLGSSNSPEEEYRAFWLQLSKAYPVSKGEMRVPIVTELQHVLNFSVQDFLSEMTVVLEQLLYKATLPGAAAQRAYAAGEDVIVPHIDDTYDGVVRFDCVLNERGEIKILELNADYPDGLLLHDKTYSVLSGRPCAVHESAFLSYFPDQTSIHISHARDAKFLDAYYAEAAILREVGHHVTIGADTPESSPRWHRRCMESSKLAKKDLAWCESVHPQHLNSFALRTLGYKDLLAAIDHPYALKTFVVNSDNKLTVLTNQAGYVLKPAHGCEGRGIFFGFEHSAVAWANIVDTLPPGYIAQEYVKLPRRAVSVYEEGTVVTKELYFDICPHFFIKNGKIVTTGHLLMRFSASPVVNVSLGGAVGYHFLGDA